LFALKLARLEASGAARNCPARRNITDEIVCLSEHFVKMRCGAGANVRDDVGVGPMGLVVASNRGQGAGPDNVLEILPHAAVQRGIDIGRGGAAWHRRSGTPGNRRAPESIHTDRPWGDYILWGYCFGTYINRAVLAAILKPLVTRPGLRRADGEAGQIGTGETQFPQRFVAEWE
jgi:hypothetical protein